MNFCTGISSDRDKNTGEIDFRQNLTYKNSSDSATDCTFAYTTYTHAPSITWMKHKCPNEIKCVLLASACIKTPGIAFGHCTNEHEQFIRCQCRSAIYHRMFESNISFYERNTDSESENRGQETVAQCPVHALFHMYLWYEQCNTKHTQCAVHVALMRCTHRIQIGRHWTQTECMTSIYVWTCTTSLYKRRHNNHICHEWMRNVISISSFSFLLSQSISFAHSSPPLCFLFVTFPFFSCTLQPLMFFLFFVLVCTFPFSLFLPHEHAFAILCATSSLLFHCKVPFTSYFGLCFPLGYIQTLFLLSVKNYLNFGYVICLLHIKKSSRMFMRLYTDIWSPIQFCWSSNQWTGKIDYFHKRNKKG